jgi:N-acetylated-alpha-linked acidic dipeptidase
VKVVLILALISIFVIVAGLALHFGVGQSVTDTGLDRNSQIFMSAVSAAGAKGVLQTLTRRPHIAGSNHDYDTALFVKQQFESFGFDDVQLEVYKTLLNRPLERSVQLLDSNDSPLFSCSLTEPPVPEDPTSNDPDSVLPFHGFSPAGGAPRLATLLSLFVLMYSHTISYIDAKGELVYANYGRYEDYLWLDARNISLRNKIVIVKYGKGFRGNKVKLAQDRSAIGVLIYSDPADDGAKRGPVFPQGPWRPPRGVQRGSIYTGFGDPETPLWPSTADAPRLTNLEETEVSKIPSQPLSAEDAMPLMQALSRAVPVVAAPQEWQGGYEFAYGVASSSPVIVHMKINMNYTVFDIWNVIGTIKGQIEPDRIVLLGSHRDAWTLGAGDPGTGTTVLVETARGFGALLKSGWRPRRTVMFCSWDAEEYGLIGSTEFAERHSKLLSNKAVAYLNVDVAVSASPLFEIGAVPSLTQLISTITARVLAPSDAYWKGEKLSTVFDMWRAGYMFQNHSAAEHPNPSILGSGSDFTPMLQHLGIPSMDMEITDANGTYGSVYHSNYDSFYWMSTFGDPTFEYHATVARVFGLIAKDLVEAEILTLNYTDYAIAMTGWVDFAERRSLSVFPGSSFNWKPLKAAVSRFSDAAAKVEGEKADLARNGASNRDLKIRDLNDRLILTERAFLDHRGLLGRPFLKHIVFAPGVYDSYSGTALPTINDAILHKNSTYLQFQIQYVALFVDAAVESLSGNLNLS